MVLLCKFCNKEYSSYSSRCNHIKKFHTNNKVENQPENIYKCKYCNKLYKHIQSRWKHEQKCKKIDGNDIYYCSKCEKTFKFRQGKWRHEKKCNEKKIENKFLEELDNEMIIKINTTKNEIKDEFNNLKNAILTEKEQKENNNLIIEKLINIILEKNKIIQELKDEINIVNKEDYIKESLNKTILNDEMNDYFNEIKKSFQINIDDVIVNLRFEDYYIDASEICKIGKKEFKDWYKLQTSKELIDYLNFIIKKSSIDLTFINNKGLKPGLWVHPEIAIQIGNWLSPIIGLKISLWIKLLTNKDKLIKKIIQVKDSEIKIKNEKIEILENICIKRQKRINYPEQNVIYILTTEDNKKKRIYIIGKAKKLKDRLSTYNKTSEHEVIFFKGCKTIEEMNIIETMVLTKLNIYKEKANRDRFILPIEKNISFFIDIIIESINFFNLKKLKEKEIEI